MMEFAALCVSLNGFSLEERLAACAARITESLGLYDQAKQVQESHAQVVEAAWRYLCGHEERLETAAEPVQRCKATLQQQYGDRLVKVSFKGEKARLRQESIDGEIKELWENRGVYEFQRALGFTHPVSYRLMEQLYRLAKQEPFEAAVSSTQEVIRLRSGTGLGTRIQLTTADLSRAASAGVPNLGSDVQVRRRGRKRKNECTFTYPASKQVHPRPRHSLVLQKQDVEDSAGASVGVEAGENSEAMFEQEFDPSFELGRGGASPMTDRSPSLRIGSERESVLSAVAVGSSSAVESSLFQLQSPHVDSGLLSEEDSPGLLLDNMSAVVRSDSLNGSDSPNTGALLESPSSGVSGARTTLLPGQCLSATAIEIGLSVIRIAMHDILVFDPQYYNVEKAATPIRRKDKPIPLHVRKVLLPLYHQRIKHWTLAVLELSTSSILHYDSLNNCQGCDTNEKALLHFARQHFADRNINWIVTPAETARQNNDYDCGIHTLVAAFFTAADMALPTADSDCSLWRQIFNAFFESMVRTDHESSPAPVDCAASVQPLVQPQTPDTASYHRSTGIDINYHAEDPTNETSTSFSNAEEGTMAYESANEASKAAKQFHSRLEEILKVLTQLESRCGQAASEDVEKEVEMQAEATVLDDVVHRYTTELTMVKRHSTEGLLRQELDKTKQKLAQLAKATGESRRVMTGLEAARHFAVAKCSEAANISTRRDQDLVLVRRKLRVLAAAMMADAQRMEALADES